MTAANEGITAINLIPVRAGVDPQEFVRFSIEIDRPACLAHEVVTGFDVFAVTRRDPAGPAVDIVELMHLRSWDEWVRVRDNDPALVPVGEQFSKLADPDAVRTLLGVRVSARSSR